MHVCLFTIPKPTQTDRHTPRPTTARRLHAPGHGRPGNTSRPLAPLRRSTGPHHTAYTKAVEREGCQSGRESRRPTVGTHTSPHTPIPEVTELTQPTTILGHRISSSRCAYLHTSSQTAHSRSLPEMGTVHVSGDSFNLHHTPHKQTRRFIQASNEPLVIVTLGRQDPRESLKPAVGSMPLRGPGRSGSEAPPAYQAGTPWPAKPLQLRHPPTKRQSAGVVGLQAAAALCCQCA